MDIFFELHQDLPREGPGDDASTRRALEMLTDLPPAPMILDVGCGPGMQTLELARSTRGLVTAVDTHQPFLDVLQQNARAAGLQGRITARHMSMFALDFPAQSFDLIWSEGAIYIIGFEAGLRAWRKLLKPQAYLAATELSWLRADPPAELADFWQENYPGMRSIAGNRASIAAAGYREIGLFVLPAESWWENYYTPQEARIALLRERYSQDSQALLLLDESQREINLYRKYADWYGYVFFVMQLAAN